MRQKDQVGIDCLCFSQDEHGRDNGLTTDLFKHALERACAAWMQPKPAGQGLRFCFYGCSSD